MGKLAEIKRKETSVNVDFINTLKDEKQRKDCLTLVKLSL
jgi:hypothetical protein